MTISPFLHDALCDAGLFAIGLILIVAVSAVAVEWIVNKVTERHNSPYRAQIRELNRQLAEMKRESRREKAAYKFINNRKDSYGYSVRYR